MTRRRELTPWHHAWQPCAPLPLAGFIERHVELPANYARPGALNLARSRYLLGPIGALEDPAVREVTILKAVQSGGSLLADLWMTHIIRRDPGPFMMNMQTDQDAKDHAQMRITPMLEGCPLIRDLFPENRHKKLKTQIFFQLMWLLLQGANQSNLQSKSVRYLVNDELAHWRVPGLLVDARGRVTAFGWRAKILNISQAGIEGDEMDEAFKAGTQEEWSFKCPKCKFLQAYKWQYEDHTARGGMKWTKDETTCPGGEWDFDALATTIRYECRSCGHGLRDTTPERTQMNDSGEFVTMNPRAPKDTRSFHWNALAAEDIRWSLLVREWLLAMEDFKRGDIERLKRFIQKRLAESFGEKFTFLEGTATQNRDYKLGDAWPAEFTRFLTIDRQQDHRWYVCRAWAANGESRLVEAGRCLTDDDARAVQLRLGVADDRTWLDSGFEADEVYELCCIFGWRAMKGTPQKAFRWEGDDKQPVWLPYSRPTRINPTIGYNRQKRNDPRTAEFLKRRRFQYALLCNWSQPWIADFVQRLKTGRGCYWGVAQDAPKEYDEQLEGEKKLKKRSKKTGREEWTWVKVGRRGNHLLDCERMNLVCAIADNLLTGAVSDTKPEEEASEPEPVKETAEATI